MGGFFNMDGPFYKFGNMLADIMLLSFLWIIFSIPIITIGASTTALYYVATRRISNHEKYIIKDFWKSFKENFKQSTIVWLIILIIGRVLIFNFLNMFLRNSVLDLSETAISILLPMQIVLFVELVFHTLYIFPIISRFEVKLKDALKTTFFMVHRHLLTTLLFIALAFLLFVPVNQFFILILIYPGAFAILSSYFFMRIFKKYYPDMDEDSAYMTELQDLNLNKDSDSSKENNENPNDSANFNEENDV